MICEPLRILLIGYAVENLFINGGRLNEKLLILEHMWTLASRIILDGTKTLFDLYICDECEEDKVTYNELYHSIIILKNLKGVKLNGGNNKVEEFDRLLITKYMHACFGKYLKKVSFFLLLLISWYYNTCHIY